MNGTLFYDLKMKFKYHLYICIHKLKGKDPYSCLTEQIHSKLVNDFASERVNSLLLSYSEDSLFHHLIPSGSIGGIRNRSWVINLKVFREHQ